MAGLFELLGPKLLSKDGEVDTAAALKEKKAIALYFSGHWCPPCRGFTPKLAEWYASSLKAKGLEIVFVSSDRDESKFKEYFGEMPWLALPYSERQVKAALDKRFQVEGIPSVVVLDPQGELITKDGRAEISMDPEGNQMPEGWKPKTFVQLFNDAPLLGPEGSKKKGSDLSGTVFGIYFSAHWCPPCRGFTPKLAEWYNTSLKQKGFEVVFVSSDKSEQEFKEYFGEQPWLALDYSERTLKEKLSKKFGVSGIPCFVIIDKDGSVITKDARAAVSGDPTGEEFPWYPKPVANSKNGPSSLNKVPTLLAFCETSDKETQRSIEEAMEPIGKKFKAEAKESGKDEPDMAFMIVTENEGLAQKLRDMLGLPQLSPSTDAGSEAMQPRMMILDIPDEGGYYKGPEGNVTTAAVQKLVDDYSAKTIQREQLS
jgi:nucleoredoxin